VRVLHRTARCRLRVTRAQRRRLMGLLASAGDVWCAVLEINAWRRARQDAPLAGYQDLCRELARAGRGTFGELDSVGARSVLRRYSDAWMATARRRRTGDTAARFPRRRRRLVPVRWYHGTFTFDGRRLRLPVTRGRPPLWVRLDRGPPYPPEQIRSVTLVCDAGRLWADVTAEVPSRDTRLGRSRTRPRWPGSIPGSSTRTWPPGLPGRGCWSRAGRSAPSTTSTCATGRPAPGPLPGGLPSPGRKARGDGGSSAAAAAASG
jgi:hypothetical protein